jgi:hypothetical protein
MGLQSHGSPNFRNFGTFNLGIPGQNDIWVLAPWLGIDNTIREGGGFPQVRVVVSLMSPCLAVVYPCTKNAPTMHKPTCCLVCVSPCE